MDAFGALAQKNRGKTTINFCLMPQDGHELPGVLRYAEARGSYVNVVPVRNPMPCAVTSPDVSELSALASEMARRGDGLETDLRINKDIWLQTLERLLEPHGRDGGSGGHGVHLFTRMWRPRPFTV